MEHIPVTCKSKSNQRNGILDRIDSYQRIPRLKSPFEYGYFGYQISGGYNIYIATIFATKFFDIDPYVHLSHSPLPKVREDQQVLDTATMGLGVTPPKTNGWIPKMMGLGKGNSL